MMDHTNIARVLDAGSTEDGAPYFVMELVKGIPITEYCDKLKLSIEHRLNLFIEVCRAVQHAHQKGIIHRDIKPGNILVGEHNGKPLVKVIDFGLAKALQNTHRLTDKTMFTEIGQVVGTLQYMSPEQAEMNPLDVDTRSDVYSLGVLLYELLTGSTPIERHTLKQMALDRVMLAIREDEPQRPSQRLSSIGDSAKQISLQRRMDTRKLGLILKGDLDWIAMKSLEKNRNRRYESPAQLAEDVQRFLDNEAVIARPPSWGYQLSKGVRRHRSAILAATLLLLALIGGFAATGLQWNRAESALGSLEKSNHELERANKDLVNLNEDLETQKGVAVAETGKAQEAQHLAERRKTENEKNLARTNYHLAIARWDENRVTDAFDFLNRVSPEHRHIEWYLARQHFDESELTCYGHTKRVTSVALSPDGRQIVSGSHDRTVKLWDAETGEELRTWSGHISPVSSAAFSPDGRRVVSASWDKTIKLWEVETGKEFRTLSGHTATVTSVSYSSDGRLILSGSSDRTAKLWDSETGEEIRSFEGHSGAVNRVAFSPDGRQIVSWSDDKTGKVWDAETGVELQTVTERIGAVRSIVFSPDGLRFVTESFEGPMMLWDAGTGEELRSLNNHTLGLSFLAFGPDSGQIVSGGSRDETVKLWDAHSGEELRTLKGHSGFVTSVSFSPDGRRVVSGSVDGTVKLWDARKRAEIQPYLGYTGISIRMEISPDGRRFVTGSPDGTVKLWDVETGEELRTFKGHSAQVTGVAFSPDGRRILSGSGDQTIKLWDSETGEEIRTLKGHPDMVRLVSFSPDGQRIVSSSWGGMLKLWDADTGIELRTWRNAGLVTSVSFRPDGRRFVSGGAEGTVKLWDAETGEVLQASKVLMASVARVVFSPDGRRIVSGSSDENVKLWDAETVEELRTMTGHTGLVTGVAFSPDGQRIVSGSLDQTVKLWDTETGEELRTLKGHNNTVASVAISPDGQRIISVSGGRTVRLWDAKTNAEARTLKGHTDEVTRVRLSPDGQQIVSEDTSGEKIVWDTKTGMRRYDLKAEEFRRYESTNTASDGQWLVLPYQSDIRLIDRGYKARPEVLGFRKSRATPDPHWHKEQAEAAKNAGDLYAQLFHQAWLLKIQAKEDQSDADLKTVFNQYLNSQTREDPILPDVARELLNYPRVPLVLTSLEASPINRTIWKKCQNISTKKSHGSIRQIWIG